VHRNFKLCSQLQYRNLSCFSIVRFSKEIYICEDYTMLRRSLFACALMLAGIVGFASSAKAAETDTQDVTFGSFVNATCNLTAAATGSTSGELAFPDATTKTQFVTTTPAMVGVDCTGGTLTVSEPVLTTKPAGFNDTNLTNKATITLGANSADNTIAAGISAGTTPSDVMVEMTSTNTADFIPGPYVYTVTVTATK
jgi:hypothetical protein